MPADFLLASAFVSFEARGISSVLSGLDRMRAGWTGMAGAQARLESIQAAGASAMVNQQQQLASRIQSVQQAASAAQQARAAQTAMRIQAIQARMGGASVAQQARLQAQITAIQQSAGLARAVAAQRLALRLQGIQQAGGAAQVALAQSVGASVSQASEAVESAGIAGAAGAFLGIAAAIAAVTYAAYEMAVSFEKLNDAGIELDNTLKIEGQDAAGASSQLKEHAASLAEFANISRLKILGMETATLRLGVSAGQAGRAVEIAIGLAKARGVDVESALRAVNMAIEGREMGLRRLMGLRRGGTGLSGNALLAQATAMGEKGLELQHAAATTEWEGKVALLSRRFETLSQTMGEAFGHPMIAALDFLTTGIEDITEAVQELGQWAKDTGTTLTDVLFGPDVSDAMSDLISVMKDGWGNFKNYMVYIWHTILDEANMAVLQMQNMASHPIDFAMGKLQDTDEIKKLAKSMQEDQDALVNAQLKIEDARAKAKAGRGGDWGDGGDLLQERSQTPAQTFEPLSYLEKLAVGAAGTIGTDEKQLDEAKKTNEHLAHINEQMTKLANPKGLGVIGP